MKQQALDNVSYKADQLCSLLTVMNMSNSLDEKVSNSLIALALDLSIEVSNTLIQEQGKEKK